MSIWGNIVIRKIAGVPRTSPEVRDSTLDAAIVIWQKMGLTSQQMAFGVAMIGVESTFNSTAQATTSAFGLGQFTKGTWQNAK